MLILIGNSTTDITLSTNQNLNIVCDTSNNYIRHCHVTLFIQIPTFDRKIVLLQPVLTWAVRLSNSLVLLVPLFPFHSHPFLSTCALQLDVYMG